MRKISFDDHYSVKELKKFLQNFIQKYREKIAEGNKPKSNCTDFTKPSQIYLIWFFPYDQQFFYVLHDNSIKDRSIFVKKLSYANEVEELSNWVNSEIIGYLYKDLFLMKLKQIIEFQPHRIYHYWIKANRKSIPLRKVSRISSSKFHNGFIWHFDGILKLNMDDWIEGTLTSLDKVENKAEKKKEETKKQKKPLFLIL